MNIRNLLSGCACLTMFALAGSAQAAFVTNGNLFAAYDPSGAQLGSTVDHWYFTVNTAGTVSFDLLSMEVDENNGSLFVDVNGDGEIAFSDPYIYLFFDDGSLDAADVIAVVDDDFSNTYGDGSIHGYDSYLSLPLVPGNYAFAVGAFGLSTDDAIDGFNDFNTYPVTTDYLPNDHGDYQITWDGDVTITRDPGTGVTAATPEPASLAMFGIGSLGLAFLRRRRTVAA
jgi:hypothetical protein